MKATHKFESGEKVAIMRVQMTVTLDLIAFCMLEAAELTGTMADFDVNTVEDMVISQLQSDGQIHYQYRMDKWTVNEIRNAKNTALRLFPSFKTEEA
ncbi:MAG: hypothetical protein ACYTEQ_30820 [Planctomycetota bacterium]|jgi:hypothetical protein